MAAKATPIYRVAGLRTSPTGVLNYNAAGYGTAIQQASSKNPPIVAIARQKGASVGTTFVFFAVLIVVLVWMEAA